MLLPKFVSATVSLSLSIALASHTAFAQGVDTSTQLRNLVNDKSFIRAGSALFETDDLAKVYGHRNNLPIWTENGAATAFALALKPAIQKLASKHGLVFSDYWTQELEKLFDCT